MSTSGTDRDVLRRAAYADRSKLDDRRSIYAYRTPPFDLIDAVLDCLPLPPGARVLDLGCGPGLYLAALQAREPSVRLVGADLSAGMLGSARASGVTAVTVAEATCLPFATAGFDGVMANHMLYHVDPIEAAAREVRRVLRPGGTFLAVTNARSHFAEFDALLAEVSGRDGWWRPSQRFTLENGRAMLEPAFDSVDVVHFEGEIHVDEVAPVVRFARSMRDLSGASYDDDSWESLMQRFEVAVAARIADEGDFRTDTNTGVFICR